MMVLVVFGATGRTGRHVVEGALQAGYHVVAFTRQRAKAPWRHERVQVIEGDARDPDDVDRAVKGADAVVSVLAPPENRPGRPITQAMANIVRSMRAHGVDRLVASTGAGVSFPQDDPKLLNKLIGWMVRTFSRYVYEDMKGAAEQVVTSELDWTLVRVPVLTDDEPKGDIRVGYVGKGTGARLTRRDMAKFILDQVESDKHLHDVPVISN